ATTWSHSSPFDIMLWAVLKGEPGRSKNVAPQGIPSQSSYFGSKLEVRAPIDGSLRSNYMAGECAHTKKEMNPWWRVDLKSKMVIQSVAITNRLECCRERINGAELRVGDSKENGGIGNPRCGVVNRMNYGETLSFDCKGMEGQYVTITLPNREYLTLCEMQVTGDRICCSVIAGFSLHFPKGFLRTP
uniref:Fucolectin tachylectin-4 pentraxin-1 domain-containing protein n=1 Tax=Leptobrachium leishanense TaxID=445787 RepID=A0A8C5QWE1_9ANUR